jgi:hypothetical protein
VGDTSHLTSFSIDGEYTPITSSEATQSLSNGLRGDSNGEVSTNLTGDCRPSSLICFQTLASTISFTGDPEVPTTRRVGPEEESEPLSDRPALYRIVYLDFGDHLF